MIISITIFVLLMLTFYLCLFLGADYNSPYKYKGFSNTTIKNIRKGLMSKADIVAFRSAITSKEKPLEVVQVK